MNSATVVGGQNLVGGLTRIWSFLSEPAHFRVGVPVKVSGMIPGEFDG